MLTIFARLNPFFYGVKTNVEDLVQAPLQANETLMQDSQGCCRRIKAPSTGSTFCTKMIFWIRTHLNEKGHLDAIDKLISLFHENLLQNPPKETDQLQEIHHQIEILRSLKNDYGFIYTGNPSSIDERLLAIEHQAYSIFEYYHQKQALEQEEVRKKIFFHFRKNIEQKFADLSFHYLYGLNKERFLILAEDNILEELFEERRQNLCDRLEQLQNIHQEMNAIEQMNQGKFTIPFIKEYLDLQRLNLCLEIYKINIEVEFIIENLLLNYRLFPFNEKAEEKLRFLHVDPEKTQREKIVFSPLHESFIIRLKYLKSLLQKKDVF